MSQQNEFKDNSACRSDYFKNICRKYLPKRAEPEFHYLYPTSSENWCGETDSRIEEEGWYLFAYYEGVGAEEVLDERGNLILFEEDVENYFDDLDAYYVE